MTITFRDPENKYIKEYPKDVHKGYFFANGRLNNINKGSFRGCRTAEELRGLVWGGINDTVWHDVPC